MGATEEHNLTEVYMFLCTILKLFLNETILVVEIIKPVAVSNLPLKKKETKLYGFVYTDYR